MKDHGLPSREYRNSGSKLSLLSPAYKTTIAAGSPNENAGISENPLLVMLTDPLKVTIRLVVSVCCEKAQQANKKRKITVAAFLLIGKRGGTICVKLMRLQ